MDKVRYYYIAGVGNIIALELGQYETRTEIAWPAVAMNMIDPRNNQPVLQLQNFVPEFCSDCSKMSKSMMIPNNLIIMRSSVNKQLEDVYKQWQQKSHQKTTGILIPEIRSGRALN